MAGVRGEYVFSANNPVLGDKEALEKGKDLVRCDTVWGRGWREGSEER